MALKASWFKRIYKSCDGWAIFPNMYGLNGVYKYGNIYINIFTQEYGINSGQMQHWLYIQSSIMQNIVVKIQFYLCQYGIIKV